MSPRAWAVPDNVPASHPPACPPKDPKPQVQVRPFPGVCSGFTATHAKFCGSASQRRELRPNGHDQDWGHRTPGSPCSPSPSGLRPRKRAGSPGPGGCGHRCDTDPPPPASECQAQHPPCHTKGVPTSTTVPGHTAPSSSLTPPFTRAPRWLLAGLGPRGG